MASQWCGTGHLRTNSLRSLDSWPEELRNRLETKTKRLKDIYYMSDFVKKWPLGFRLAPVAAQLQANAVSKYVGVLPSW